MAWGDHAEWLEAESKRTGEIFPALVDRPRIGENLRFVWQAFFALNSDRQVGMDVGPIMFSSIEGYARRYGIEGIDAFDRFFYLIRAMDVEFRKPKPAPPGA